jgi:hypothetical protein
MLQKEGLYILPGDERHALLIIVKDQGQTLWMRNFATIEDLLNILEDDVLEGHDRSAIAAQFKKRSFFTTEYAEPEGGFVDVAFKKFVLSK